VEMNGITARRTGHQFGKTSVWFLTG
jgi:hypothetical protein